MKKPLAILFSMLFLINFGGCVGKKKLEINRAFDFPCEYNVSYRIGMAKGTAKIKFTSGGEMSVLHTDTESPLFGMEEIFGDDFSKKIYQDLVLDESEIYSPVSEIRCIFSALSIKTYYETTSESVNEIPCYQYTFTEENGEITLFAAQKSLEPVKIKATLSGYDISLQFKSSASSEIS